MSFQENIVHASDSPETAAVELNRFFRPKRYLSGTKASSPASMLATNIKRGRQKKLN